MHCLSSLLFHCFLIPLLGYWLFIYSFKIQFEITATILITNFLLIWRVQFMEIGCQGGRRWRKVGNHWGSWWWWRLWSRQMTQSYFFLFSWYTTRVSPVGIPWDIYSSFFFFCCYVTSSILDLYFRGSYYP